MYLLFSYSIVLAGGEAAYRITFKRIRHVFKSIVIQNLGNITLLFHSQDVLGK